MTDVTQILSQIESGDPTAAEQLFPLVYDELRNEYDFVIIDGAPIIGMSDALLFGQYSDGAILSVRRDHSQMPKINHADERFRNVGIRNIRPSSTAYPPRPMIASSGCASSRRHPNASCCPRLNPPRYTEFNNYGTGFR